MDGKIRIRRGMMRVDDGGGDDEGAECMDEIWISDVNRHETSLVIIYICL